MSAMASEPPARTWSCGYVHRLGAFSPVGSESTHDVSLFSVIRKKPPTRGANGSAAFGWPDLGELVGGGPSFSASINQHN